MSQYGPPPDDPEQPGANQPPEPPGGGSSSEPPYGAPPPPNPYGGQPDPYGQPNPYGQQDPYRQQSPYGQPSPYGQQNPYGGQQDPYGQQPYGQPPTPPNPYAPAGSRPDRPLFGFSGYASWLSRVGASIIDIILAAVAGLPYWIGQGMRISTATSTTDRNGVRHFQMHTSTTALTLIVIGVLTYLAFWIWNTCIRQGRTGATLGKSVLAIRLVGINTMQPIGGGMSFLRQLTHILDKLPCYLGYLWPLWDAKNQTFSDKIMSTVVISATEPRQY
jgi:uncharacterized RDD family membrane protein YckC